MSEPSYKQASILLVEDDDVDAMGVDRALKKMRLANPMVRARDGVEGLALLRSGEVSKPYIILLDLNMPRMGGLEFLEELRRDSELHKSIVFVLTTSKRDQEIAAAYEKNIAGYIVKTTLNEDFDQLLGFLDHYWRLVELPE